MKHSQFQYVGDTQLVLSLSSNPREDVEILEQGLEVAGAWMKASKLKLHRGGGGNRDSPDLEN